LRVSNFNNILVIFPYTIDVEFNCGGTIAKLVKEGKNVYYPSRKISNVN